MTEDLALPTPTAQPIAGGVWFEPAHPDPAGAALAFFERLDARRRRAILWDVPDEDKVPFLEGQLEAAEVSGFAWVGNTPAAFAWGNPSCKGSRTLAAHFSFCQTCPPEYRERIGHAFLAECAVSFRQIACMLPVQWAGAIVWLKRLGFEEAARFKGGCRIEHQNRNLDGVLLVYDLAKVKR